MVFVQTLLGADVFVEISSVPEDGFVVCPMDMTPAANWLDDGRIDMYDYYAGDKKIDVVFVPGPVDGQRGTFVAVLPNDIPRGKPCRLRLQPIDGAGRSRSLNPQFVLKTTSAEIVFEEKKQGGLPTKISFKNGKTLENQRWFDRLFDPETGSWNIADNKDARLESIVTTPFVEAVRIETGFRKPDGTLPSSKPRVVYQWFAFSKQELVYVVAKIEQESALDWKEKHLFELHIPDGSFGKWIGDDTIETFTGSKRSRTFSRYSAFLDNSGNTIAAIAPGTIMYDGLNSFGPYLLPRGNDAWKPWNDKTHRCSTWFWIGNAPDPARTLQAVYEKIQSMPHAGVVIPEFEQPVKDWKTAALNDLFLSGKISSKKKLDKLRRVDKWPESWTVVETDDLGMILEKSDDRDNGKGLRLLSLVDKKTNTLLSARESVPIFSAEVLDKETGKRFSMTSDDGWSNVDIRDSSEGTSLQIIFEPDSKRLPAAENMRVNFYLVYGDGSFQLRKNGFTWTWWVEGNDRRYEFRKVSCPQIALRNLGPAMQAFYPHASGAVTSNPVGKEFRWHGTYPSGWCSMQYTAAYDETKNTGLYVASPCSGGAVKDIRIETNPAADSLTIRFEQPLPVGDVQTWSVRGDWQALHGDWYDAASIYRDWVRKKAAWYPRKKTGHDGRIDTPQWMKELCVWAQCGDPPEKMPETMRKFTDALGVPTGVHWYNWHKIPFDNDYPHYFPAKDGFKEAVGKIQKNGDCYVMPYINGRLWDTRDKGVEDFQFTSVALPGATKKEDGKSYVETYGSKETDGSKVELAVMCPGSRLWKDKVREITLRLLTDNDVHGVYIDQVAAAKPELCFDKSHGHPLGGGNWWNSAYWDMFEEIRAEMPQGKMLTTECNAEPFVNVFDGYLTWHFQYQDQVPAFAAVYGGSVQMFGRAHGGGASRILADRMKAAQQLVYGEQIGWLDPRIVDDPARFPFFKEIVRTRFKYRDYFYKGEMCRPPKLSDKIPTVTADWQWHGETNITADAVFTGSWKKTDENGKTVSAVFLFVNVSKQPVTSRVDARLEEIGLRNENTPFAKPLTFEPGIPLAIEIMPKNP